MSFHREPLDHGRIWLDADGRYVLTAEPYPTPTFDASLATFAEAISEFGLTVEMRPDEQWSPGDTMLLWVQGGFPANSRRRPLSPSSQR